MPSTLRPTDQVLQQGEVFAGKGSLRLRTMLGSCVTITLWHPPSRAGAMSHFLLAQRGPRRLDEPLDARYGNEALAMMVDRMALLGAPAFECQAKIVGGGDMFGGLHAHAAHGTIGRRNGEAARRMLAERGIKVQSEHLFGDGHRQVVFDLADGAVYVRQMERRREAWATSTRGAFGA